MNALTIPKFTVYFTTNTLSLLGIWIQKVGLGWLAWQITESTFWTSVVSLLLMAPVGILSPFIAVFAERWDSRLAMLKTKILMFVTSSVIFSIQLLDLHSLYTLLGCSSALGLLSAFHHPVRLVFITLVVPRSYLVSAVGMNSVSWNLSRVVGPGLAGLIIHTLGTSETFFIATILFLPLIFSLFFLNLSSRISQKNDSENFFERLTDGGKVVLRTPIIFTTLCLVGLNSFFIRSILEIQPAIAGQILGGKSSALATITAAAGIGSFCGSVWIGLGRISKAQIQQYLWPMVFIGILVTALLNLSSNLIPASTIFVITGFTTTIAGIGAQTLIQLEVNESYRARVMTWWSTISFGSLVIGGVTVGFFGDLIGIDNAILFLTSMGLLVTCILFYSQIKAKTIGD